MGKGRKGKGEGGGFVMVVGEWAPLHIISKMVV